MVFHGTGVLPASDSQHFQVWQMDGQTDGRGAIPLYLPAYAADTNHWSLIKDSGVFTFEMTKNMKREIQNL